MRIDERVDEFLAKCSYKTVKTLDELLDTKPEIIAEMNAVEAVQEYCIDVLKNKISFMHFPLEHLPTKTFIKSKRNRFTKQC